MKSDSCQYDTLWWPFPRSHPYERRNPPYRKRKSWPGFFYLGSSRSWPICRSSLGLIPCCIWQWASEKNKGINNDNRHLNFLGTLCTCTQVLNIIFKKDYLCGCAARLKFATNLNHSFSFVPEKHIFCLCGIWINSPFLILPFEKVLWHEMTLFMYSELMPQSLRACQLKTQQQKSEAIWWFSIYEMVFHQQQASC